jgi:dolichyl-phosphate-mannose-protein mannosyltransferase
VLLSLSAMTAAPAQSRDPVIWSGLIAFAFMVLCEFRLGIPSGPYFDEVHYLPAARVMLELSHVTNQEHPLLGKEIIAAGIALFGDDPVGWRTFPALAGAIALFAFMRAMWFATWSRFAALAGGILLATAFPLFVHARIAMLDIFMACFVTVALWMGAAAVRRPARWRLAVAGVALGLAMASKWNAVPIAVLPGLAFLAVRLRVAGLRFLTAKDAAPVQGVSLLEAGIWLGIVPLAAYALTFLPVFFYAQDPLTLGSFVAYHQRMVELQGMVIEPHPYQSVWWQWVLNLRAIWYLYEVADGAQRGILLIGNPLTMLIGLPALLWCVWQGAFRRNRAALAVALLYAVGLGMWVVAPKPVQFYYHYFLPSCFLVAALALLLDAAWRAGHRKKALAVVVACCAFFAGFYPILSAAPLSDGQDFLYWAWIPGWR